jgi:hypothetical protein
MYIPGRLRTASSPSRIWIFDASYEASDDRRVVPFLAVFAVLAVFDVFGPRDARFVVTCPLAAFPVVSGLAYQSFYHLGEPTPRMRAGVAVLAPSRLVGRRVRGWGVLSGLVAVPDWPTMHITRSTEPIQA